MKDDKCDSANATECKFMALKMNNIVLKAEKERKFININAESAKYLRSKTDFVKVSNALNDQICQIKNSPFPHRTVQMSERRCRRLPFCRIEWRCSGHESVHQLYSGREKVSSIF